MTNKYINGLTSRPDVLCNFEYDDAESARALNNDSYTWGSTLDEDLLYERRTKKGTQRVDKKGQNKDNIRDWFLANITTCNTKDGKVDLYPNGERVQGVKKNGTVKQDKNGNNTTYNDEQIYDMAQKWVAGQTAISKFKGIDALIYIAQTTGKIKIKYTASDKSTQEFTVDLKIPEYIKEYLKEHPTPEKEETTETPSEEEGETTLEHGPNGGKDEEPNGEGEPTKEKPQKTTKPRALSVSLGLTAQEIVSQYPTKAKDKNGVAIADENGDVYYDEKQVANALRAYMKNPEVRDDFIKKALSAYRLKESLFIKKLNESYTSNRRPLRNKIITDIYDFTPTNESINTLKRINRAGKLNAFNSLLEYNFPNGISEKELSEELHYNSNGIYRALGMSTRMIEGIDKTEICAIEQDYYNPLAIIDFEYGIDDYVIFVELDSEGNIVSEMHKAKILYENNAKGTPYFIFKGQKHYLDDFVKVDSPFCSGKIIESRHNSRPSQRYASNKRI